VVDHGGAEWPSKNVGVEDRCGAFRIPFGNPLVLFADALYRSVELDFLSFDPEDP
jgi:hypothetical protein